MHRESWNLREDGSKRPRKGFLEEVSSGVGWRQRVGICRVCRVVGRGDHRHGEERAGWCVC